MAKKITATDEQTNPAEGTTVNPAGETATKNTGAGNENTGVEEEKQPDDTTPIPPEAKVDAEEQTAPEAQKVVADNYPAFVKTILKSFSGYESLYIDSHGGFFTTATAPRIRGNAILYKNPYYNL
jgi:hypothetical protein